MKPLVFLALAFPNCKARPGVRRLRFGTFTMARAWDAMTTSVILIPGMLKPLRLARVYGFLLERWDGVYHPGGSQPACTTQLARKMVEGGWLVKHGQRYEPTEQGLKADD